MSKLDPRYDYKYLGILSTLFITFSLASIPVGYKLVEIKGLVFSGAAFILPLRYLLGDIIADIYGYKIGRKQIFYLVVACLVFSALISSVVEFPSPSYWHHQAAFHFVLASSWKLTLYGLFSAVVGLYLNVYLFSRLFLKISLTPFIVRAFLASVFGELTQYILGLTLIFHTQMNFIHLVSLIFSDYLIQILFIAVLTIPATIIQNIIKKNENVNNGVDYNPFNKRGVKNDRVE